MSKQGRDAWVLLVLVAVFVGVVVWRGYSFEAICVVYLLSAGVCHAAQTFNKNRKNDND